MFDNKNKIITMIVNQCELLINTNRLMCCEDTIQGIESNITIICKKISKTTIKIIIITEIGTQKKYFELLIDTFGNEKLSDI